MKNALAVDGFDDKRSDYTSIFDKKGLVRITGKIYIGDVEMRFSANKQKEGPLIRGRVSIISQTDGRVLQMSGRNRKKVIDRLKSKGKDIPSIRHPECFACTSEFVVDSLEEIEIKKRITHNAKKLYLKHEPTILSVQKQQGSGANYSAKESSSIHIEDFINKVYGKCVIKTKREKMNRLKRVTIFFGTIPMGKITLKMIRAYIKSNKDAVRDLRCACKFWDFCRDKGVFTGENPLETYAAEYSKTGPKVNPEKAMQKATQFYNLPFNVELNLNRIILDNISDGCYIGILLIKECAISAEEVCNIKWKNIDISGSFISINIRKENYVGATHDYTRPLTPFAEYVLAQKHSQLKILYEEKDLGNMPIAHNKTNCKKPLNSKAIRDACRTAIIRAGFDSNKLSAVYGIKHGAGVRFLNNNLRYRLENECGLAEDTAAVSFLMGNSLQKDVTADHYRSFTCPEGQQYLYNALRRDTRFDNVDIDEDNIFIREDPDGYTEYMIAPKSPQKIMSFKIKFKVKPGEVIYVSAIQGINCSISAKKAKT